jgi:hypothetical protein
MSEVGEESIQSWIEKEDDGNLNTDPYGRC